MNLQGPPFLRDYSPRGLRSPVKLATIGRRGSRPPLKRSPALRPESPLDDALRELNIYVGSAVMRQAAERAAIAGAENNVPILLTGETGTGKELFAKLIHRLSARRVREMVCINCAAIPKDLVESTLFGHVKGAFTTAVGNQAGKFELAGGSTLFLDEIGELGHGRGLRRADHREQAEPQRSVPHAV